MCRVYSTLSVSLLLGVGASCGGPSFEGNLAVRVERSELIPDGATRACLSLYEDGETCEIIENSGLRGLFEAQLVLDGAEQASSTIFEVRSGTYIAAVWLMNASNEVIGFGCEPESIQVNIGQRTEVAIVAQESLNPMSTNPCPQ